MKLLTLNLTTAVLIAVAGCTTNPASVKSSAGTDIKVTTGSSAASAGQKLDTVRGGPAKGIRSETLEVVATFDGPAMPVGIAVSRSGRTFMSFPRWMDPVKNTV